MKADKDRHNLIAQMGCLICGQPAELHHTRAGMGQRGKDVVPLCPRHHRQGPFGEAIHNGYKTFCAKYYSEEEMVEMVNSFLRGRL